MTTQDWWEEIGAAKNWSFLFALMTAMAALLTFVILASGFSGGNTSTFIFKTLLAYLLPFFGFCAILTYATWASHKQAFEWRWGRDGIGLQLLEHLLEQELVGVRNRLEVGLKKANISWNAPEWAALSVAPSLSGEAIDLLKALQAKRDVPFTDPQRWEGTRQKDVARNLTHLVQRLKELRQNKLFEDIARSLCPCMGLTRFCRNGTEMEHQELTRLLRLTSLALHAATNNGF